MVLSGEAAIKVSSAGAAVPYLKTPWEEDLLLSPLTWVWAGLKGSILKFTNLGLHAGLLHDIAAGFPQSGPSKGKWKKALKTEPPSFSELILEVTSYHFSCILSLKVQSMLRKRGYTKWILGGKGKWVPLYRPPPPAPPTHRGNVLTSFPFSSACWLEKRTSGWNSSHHLLPRGDLGNGGCERHSKRTEGTRILDIVESHSLHGLCVTQLFFFNLV